LDCFFQAAAPCGFFRHFVRENKTVLYKVFKEVFLFSKLKIILIFINLFEITHNSAVKVYVEFRTGFLEMKELKV
jgi:hypothetical protein